MSLGGAEGLLNKRLLAGNCQVGYVGRAGQVMIVRQMSGQGAHAMGMCVLETKDCDALKSVP